MVDDRPEPPEPEETFVWTSDKIERYGLAPTSRSLPKLYPHGMTMDTLLEDKKRLEEQIKLYQTLEKDLRREREVEVQKRIKAEALHDVAERHCTKLIGERDYWMELAMVFEEELKAMETHVETEVSDVDDDHNFELEL